MRMAAAAELSTEDAEERDTIPAIWKDGAKLNHKKTELCTGDEFAYIMEILDVTGLWKSEARSGERAAVLVAGIYIKKKRDGDVGGHWTAERRLMETMGTTSEIFEETQVNDVFSKQRRGFCRALTSILIPTFCCMCGTTHHCREVTSARSLEHEKKDKVGALECYKEPYW